ncbi:carboxypeptidase-like regulatory domain-containing protein [bacterium SCSIO 12741]|nr:carboxypeptidase-like regulatory domain-containing protein [bacterium SCSIO 12741]
MLKRCIALLLATFAIVTISNAQVGQGSIKGKVLDSETKEPLPFVNVVVEQNGRIVTGSTTDFDGKYVVKSLSPGKYDLKVKFVGYQPLMITGVVVNADKITFKDVDLSTTAVEMEAFEVVEYKVPLISKDNTTSGGTMTSEEIDRMATRSAAGVAQQVGGVYSDGSGNLNVRGARSDANYYYIDGIKVRANANSLPQSAIEQISVMLGGVPAQYGDVTGGVISITTKGAARQYNGSVEYVTSGYRFNDGKSYVGLDPYAYNLLEVSAMGPLWWKKDSLNKKTDPLFGFFFAGNYNFVADQRPSHLGYWKVKDDALQSLKDEPLRNHPSGTGTAHNGEFIRLNDMENTRLRPNNQQHSVNLQGKIEVNTGKNTNLTIGGMYTRIDQNMSNYDDGTASTRLYPNFLMNWENNPKRIRNTYRGYVRFTQRFNNSGEQSDASIIKNAFYSLQFDYTRNTDDIFDRDHKDDLFKYGYVGQFKTFQDIDYQFGTDSSTGQIGWIHETWRDTLIGFTPSDANPAASAYTSNYYRLFGWQGYDSDGNPVFDKELATDPNDPDRINKNLSERTVMQTNGALWNGDIPDEIYGIWNSPAERINRYSKREQNQYRLSAQGAVDIGDHEIKLGFEYEQRVDREFIAAPNGNGATGLWGLGRSLVNSHVSERDLANPIIDTLDYLPGWPAFTYPRLNAAPGDYTYEDPQSFFDYNLRQSLGLNPDGTDFIDFDNLTPEQLKIDYYSAEELLNNGNSIVTYYGFDHHGNRISGNSSLEDFFNKRDQYGNPTRNIDAFRPIYVAGYIQDKFSIDDLIFNVGLRIDRYDANQKVLKDPWVLFPTVKAGEAEALELADGNHPENIGEDYVVYVDDVTDPTAIRGYRDGSTWYNAEGVEISNPDVIATSNGIAPLLVDKTKTNSRDMGIDAFEDYSPQTNFMPRIAFSFPISDEALFFAHYDILTKRPTGGYERLDPTDYLYLETTSGTRLRNNPDLKPEKTIDYEIGFQQKLTKSSALKLSAFYREFRDQVQVVRRKQAYPREYTTLDNIDFGTVKGLTLGYELKRTGNVSMRASYTLQFAEGTGSDQTTAQSLINAGKDNLKITTPLNYDQRHAVQVVFDFRYGEGKDYNGPVIGNRQILNRTGMNLTANVGSGTPYTGQTLSTGNGFTTNQGNAFVKGSINGNRLPWNFRMDARIDKDFTVKVGKEKSKNLDMTVYLQILNVLNTRNVRSVYRYTGTTEDDGYLNDPQWANDIQGQNDPQSFSELYGIKTSVGTQYNLPRQTRIGIRLAF